MPRAHASKVAEADLPALVEELGPQLRYAYLETAAACSWGHVTPGLAPGEAARGRLFGPACDLQFWRQGDGFGVRLISDLPRPAVNGETIDLTGFDAEEVTYLLWGRHEPDAGAWVESGFRRQWQYPVPDSYDRVGVRAMEYRDRTTGELQFIRYLDLVPIPETEEEAT